MRAAFRILPTLLVLAPAGALAADYDPPLVIEQEPVLEEVVPVEVGSGWYLRGDVSYTINAQRYQNLQLLGVQPVTNIRFGAGVGAGYHFTDWLRADAQIGFLGMDYANATVGTRTASASHSAWTGMVNAYVDLGTFAKFTPYVGAGVGMMRTQHAITVTDTAAPANNVAISTTQYGFAYSAEAGVAYRLTNNLSIDLGYRFLSSPGTEQINFTTLAVERGVTHHQVRAGLRFDLW
jgi:opacity protein-like surface antigen